MLHKNESLAGPLPVSLTNLVNLSVLLLDDTQLCVPADDEFQAWLANVSEVKARTCDVSVTDREILSVIYDATGGPDWHNNVNWLSDLPTEQWYGVTTDSSGRVEGLELESNNLTGTLPGELGQLAMLRSLKLARNDQLTGPLPRELTGLDLETLLLEETGLCAPADDGFQAWLRGVSNSGVAVCAMPTTDREILTVLYHATNGPNWKNSAGWLSDLSLDQWYGVATNDSGRVVKLELQSNRLSGPIPPELGQLEAL